MPACAMACDVSILGRSIFALGVTFRRTSPDEVPTKRSCNRGRADAPAFAPAGVSVPAPELASSMRGLSVPSPSTSLCVSSLALPFAGPAARTEAVLCFLLLREGATVTGSRSCPIASEAVRLPLALSPPACSSFAPLVLAGDEAASAPAAEAARCRDCDPREKSSACRLCDVVAESVAAFAARLAAADAGPGGGADVDARSDDGDDDEAARLVLCAADPFALGEREVRDLDARSVRALASFESSCESCAVAAFPAAEPVLPPSLLAEELDAMFRPCFCSRSI